MFLMHFCKLLFILFFITELISAKLNQIRPDNAFTIGSYSYKTLVVDVKSTSLYVGARGHLFRLWLYNINDTASSNLFASRVLSVNLEERDECIRMGNTENECSNWVRLVFVKSNGQLMLCSSSGMKPQISILDGNTLTDTELPKSIIGICSPHESLNTSAVYVEHGNPEDLPSVYSGIRTGLSLENHLIYRPPLVFNNKEIYSALRTIYTDSKWLDEPQFVGSFSIQQYVYFFFREVAVEANSCGASRNTIYSRVARICKSDLGGKNVLRQVWSSFVKARLNCSLNSGTSNFYFDHIQSIYKIDQTDSAPDTIFYATFTSVDSPFQASAICSYSINAINQIFDNGIFLEQPTPTSIWVQTPPDRVPTNRPGTCAVDSRTNLSDEDLHFAKSHLLMAESVSAGKPIFFRRDETLTKIVADMHDEQRAVLFVLSPHQNKLLKILHRRVNDHYSSANKKNYLGQLLAVYSLPSTSKNAIHSMALLKNEYLYIGEESQVAQYSLRQCALHSECASCANDPYCSWNIARSECFAHETVHAAAVGWIINSEEHGAASVSGKCENYFKAMVKTLYPGDSLHLECKAASGGEEYEWKIDRKSIPKNPTLNLIHTIDGGIVLMNNKNLKSLEKIEVTNAQSGTYQCFVDNSLIIEYSINVDDADCARPRTVEQFRSVQREWCKKYDSYKSNLVKWQSWYENNNSNCQKNKISEEFSLLEDGAATKNTFA